MYWRHMHKVGIFSVLVVFLLVAIVSAQVANVRPGGNVNIPGPVNTGTQNTATQGTVQGSLDVQTATSKNVYTGLVKNAGTKQSRQVDVDEDGYSDSEDNCPNESNWNQEDADFDGRGNICDQDADGDGIPNGQDNCANEYQGKNTNTRDDNKDGCVDVSDETILFRTRKLNPQTGLDPKLRQSSGKTYVYLQVKKFPTQQERQILSGLGVSILGYLPRKAYFISVDGSKLQAVANLNFFP